MKTETLQLVFVTKSNTHKKMYLLMGQIQVTQKVLNFYRLSKYQEKKDL